MGTATYRTRQRELIWNYLCENRTVHIAAEDIVAHLRAQGTSVGKSTVYRYLDKLVADGLVRRFFVEEGMGACYQLISDGCREHFHLKCVHCGRLFHVECSFLNEVQRHLLEEHGFTVDNTKTVLYGICRACKEKNNEK